MLEKEMEMRKEIEKERLQIERNRDFELSDKWKRDNELQHKRLSVKEKKIELDRLKTETEVQSKAADVQNRAEERAGLISLLQTMASKLSK